jgi:exonuclease SbcC
LLGWAAEQREVHEQHAAMARDVAAQATALRDERLTALTSSCAAAGLDVAGRPPRDAVVDALATTRAKAERAAERRAELARRLDERDACEASRAVADSLGRYLRSGGFVTWLLDETVQELVAGATGRLRALSHDRYSLAVDDKSSFCVIDHTNADERRLARTLSGGETFLASLALALALADEVARLSAAGAPRLESIFLDEGFGTLDAESLDVVVSAIEDLQASGRLVGLVSHVGEIAERVPVRFEVTKGTATSTVDRVVV